MKDYIKDDILFYIKLCLLFLGAWTLFIILPIVIIVRAKKKKYD